MSFTIHKNRQFIQIAKTPIQVFKTVIPPTYIHEAWVAHWEEGCWYSSTIQFGYQEGREYEEIMWGKNEDEKNIRYFGFSSYDSSVVAFRSREWPDHNLIVVEFEIPVGAEYMHNPETHTYISNRIKCIGYYPLYRSILDSFAYPFIKLFNLFNHERQKQTHRPNGTDVILSRSAS